jgi:hypothetical protein
VAEKAFKYISIVGRGSIGLKKYFISKEKMELTIHDYHDECRICLQHDGTLVEPCECKGFSAFCHVECLNKWRLAFPKDHIKRTHCEICQTPYTVPEPKKSKRKYAWVVASSTLSVTMNGAIVGTNSCVVGVPTTTESIFCFFVLLLTVANAFSFSKACILMRQEVDEQLQIPLYPVFMPQLMALICMYFLDGFHVLLSMMNYVYFLAVIIIAVKS